MTELPTEYQKFIHLSRYARWNDELKRRETWEETVDRYFNFFIPFLKENNGLVVKEKEWKPIKEAILNLRVMPSMRCLMTAGPALARDHIAGYNCSFIVISDPRAFDEILFILMNGTGVGFSVERQYISKLPKVPEYFDESDTIITVRDSKRGWAEAYRELIAMLFAGRIPRWDISKLRPAGAALKTMGGRSSGPQPLVDLFNFTVTKFKNATGRKLTSIECHDIVCKTGEVVVVGGVRRSALLSLSNLSDQRMRDAKTGNWWELEPQRAMANNSIAYTEKPEVGQFMNEWMSLYNSKSGERGIFNREAASLQAGVSDRRKVYWDEDEQSPIEFGTNPCNEILLRSREFCNLTSIIARENDTWESLKEKIELATILGTWQSCLTDFKYLTKKWKNNCEEERLLGVSITGIMDCNWLNGLEASVLFDELKDVAIDTNKKWAKKLKINQATAITCVKPSGNSSQLTNSASGIHPRHSPYYIRRVRQDMKDPLTQFMIDQKFPYEPDHLKPEHVMIFSFPIKSPENTITRKDWPAIKQLEHWKMVQDNFCEHKPSITVTVKEDEWPSVGAWVWNNFDSMSGVSFLPYSEHTYQQPPYEEITKDIYEKLMKEMPEGFVHWNKLQEYEDEDHTTATKELACGADGCEL